MIFTSISSEFLLPRVESAAAVVVVELLEDVIVPLPDVGLETSCPNLSFLFRRLASSSNCQKRVIRQ